MNSSSGYQAYQIPPHDTHGPVNSSPVYKVYQEPSDDSYGKLKHTLKTDLWNFTLCFHLMMFHNHPTSSILSYSVVKDGFVRDNEKVEMNPYKNLISFMKTDDRIKIEAKYVSQFRKWKYIRIIYQYGMRIDVYVDGLLRDYKILKPSEETRPIKGRYPDPWPGAR